MDDAQQDMLGRDKFIAEFLEYSTRTEDHIISFPGKRLSSITTLELCSAGDSFIELARAVYRFNDERARLKKAINVESGSRLVEEKSYKSFGREDSEQSG